VEVVRDVGVDSDDFVVDLHVVDADYGYDCIEHDLGGNYQKVPDSNIDPRSRWARE
jgi:hypothetical protein